MNYKSNVDNARFEKFQNNTNYQIGLVKNGYDEKIHSQNLIFYSLLGIIILLFVIILIQKRKSK